MSIFEKAVGFFRNKAEEKNVKVIVEKQDEVAGSLIAPVFREIPPNSKAGKFLTEGFRSWAFIAISAIADEISTTAIRLFKQVAQDWIEQENHPALKLIEKPNNFQTKEEFFWLMSVYWLAEGEAPIFLNNGKNPTEMVLLNPEKLTIIFDEKNIVGKYVYKRTGGTEVKIDAENILMLKMPSVLSPFRGAGVMRYIAQTLDIDNFIEEYLKLFFFNDTTPGAVLETEQELSKPIIERLKQQFSKRHQGVKNSHKLSVLEKGLKYHKISSNINELQLKELNDMIRDKVLAGFKVPKSVLGIVEDVNRANADASSYTFSKRAVLPKLKMIEAQLNQFLLPKFSDGQLLWFEFENPVFEDKLVIAQINALGLQNGWLTANEIREELGLDPFVEENYVDEETVTDENADDKKGKYAQPKEIKKVRDKKRPDALVEIMKDILQDEKPTPKKFYSQNELVQFHDDKIMFLNTVERGFIMDLKKNFRAQKRKLLKQIEGKSVKSNNLNLQLDVEAETLAMVRVANPYLYEAILKESQLTYALLSLRGGLPIKGDLVKNFVQKRTIKLGKEATATTQDAVDRIVKGWTEKGGAWTELRADLEEYFDGEGQEGANWRANMIARTELSNATGFAQQEVYKETGAVGKKWLTAVDERVCEICDAMNDQYGDGMTVGIGENFFDKGDALPNGDTNSWEAVDTPPLHPNCRCDIIPVYEESKMNSVYMRKRFSDLRDKKMADEKLTTELKEKAETLASKEIELKEKEEAVIELQEESQKTYREANKIKEKVKKDLKEVEVYKAKKLKE